MLSLFGIPLGTAFQGGTFVVLVLAMAAIVRIYIAGLPARALAKVEARKVEVQARKDDADEHTLIRTDYVQQIKDWRVEVHALRNQMTAIQGEQRKADKIIRNYEDDRRSMLFLIRLLIAELERLDPNSIIVKQAKITLEQLIQPNDPTKSSALNSAEHTVHAAQVTLDEVTEAERSK